MMNWELFDPDEEVRITSGKLPHWFQAGRLYFITYRTDDSLPISVTKLWLRQRDDWLLRQGINPRSADWKSNSPRCRLACASNSTPHFPKPFCNILIAVTASAS